MRQMLLAAGIAATATLAQADSLTHYGAISGNFFTDLPYAEYDSPDAPYYVTGDPATANLGIGLSYGLVYHDDQGIIGGRPMEYAFEVGVLQGSDSVGHALISDCYDGVGTYLGLGEDCQDRADLGSLTYWVDASAMVDFGAPGGQTDILAGIGVLHFNNHLDADYLYPLGIENFVQRDTTFTGVGLKFGGRHRIEMQNGMVLSLAGFAGAYNGERRLEINDLETDIGSFLQEQSLSVSDNKTVYVLEIRPSVTIAADWAGPGGMLEVGISHTRFLGLLDTSGYGEHDGIDLGGSVDDDVWTTSVFAGITIPM